MQAEFNKIHGRIGLIAAIVLALIALGLYFYSERAVPPESEIDTRPDAKLQPESAQDDGSGDSAPAEPPPVIEPGSSDAAGSDESVPDETPESPRPDMSRDAGISREPEVSLDRAQQRLREDLKARLGPGQIEMVVEERLLERLVTTINSLDAEPVPLRFRPLAHVPDLPRLEEDGEERRLPEDADPRYRPYRAMFDRLEAVELAELFDRYEPAVEQAWQKLGEDPDKRFRTRMIEVLDHLAEFELPRDRPAVHQPEVLYEYIDPSLEELSWGRKALIRIGPEHAPHVQRKLGELADQLARRSGQAREN